MYSNNGTFGELNSLYENISNEEGYVDSDLQEVSELITYNIVHHLLENNYSYIAIRQFFETLTEDNILDYYPNDEICFDESHFENLSADEINYLFLSEEYIDERFGGSLVRRATSLLKKAQPATTRFSNALARSKNPERTAKAIEKVTNRAAQKAKIGGLAGPATYSAKEYGKLATQAKRADLLNRSKSVVKSGVKGSVPALIGGVTGYVAGRSGNGGASTPSSLSDVESSEPLAKRTSASAPAARPASAPAARPAAPKNKDGSEVTRTGKNSQGDTPMQQWAKNFPELAAKVKPGSSGYKEIQQVRTPEPAAKKEPTAPSPAPSAEKTQKKEVPSVKKKRDIRDRPIGARGGFDPRLEKRESYDYYDIVLEFLMNEGHADDIHEANYIMLEMDSQQIKNIIENVERGPILPGEKGKRVHPKGSQPGPTGAKLPKLPKA